MKKILVVIAIFFFVIAVRVNAADQAEAPHDLFRFDTTVEISAPVTGDLYVAGRDILLRGPVAGDILAVGRHVVIEGAVAGNVRAVGETVELRGPVAGNVSVAAQALMLDAGASVGKNVTFVGQAFDTAGALHGDAQLFLFDTGQSHLAKTAKIDGTFTVRASVPPVIDEGAVLARPVAHEVPPVATTTLGDFLFDRVIAFFSMLLIGLVVVHLALRPSLVIASIMSNRPWRDVGWGLLLLLLPPVVAVFLALTVIGIPLAVMLAATWASIVYGARIFVALTLGLHLFAKLDRKKRFHSIVLPLVTGVALVTIAESLPLLGGAITVLATLWALGGIALFIRTFFGAVKASTSHAPHTDDKN